MKNRLLLSFYFLTLTLCSQGQEINFSEHIAPIIYNNCTSCHRPGEVAPIPFTNYQQVSSWATTIKHVTQSKYMPPWPPDRNFSHFVGERVLTEEEINIIADWADAGAPQGDPKKEPAIPQFSSGSQIGIPDLVLKMAESYHVEGNNQDDYRVFVIPTGFTEDKEIASIEFRPDNNRAVHHVLFAYDDTGTAARLDANSPNVYGYESFGDFGIDEATYLAWTYTPGNAPVIFPRGIGQTIPAGADLLIQVHYAPLPTDEVDQSSINIFFKNEEDPIAREVSLGEVYPLLIPGGFQNFVIPANEKATFVANGVIEEDDWTFTDFATFEDDISLISVLPHSHFLGESYKIFAITPQGDTLNIIQIKDWDFNWQGAYTLDRMLKIPAGSRLVTIASYDNTIDNPNNPSNPPINVRWGEGTEDEMLVVFLYYVSYQPGDENVELGNQSITVSTTSSSISQKGDQLLSPTPNPNNGNFILPFNLIQPGLFSFELFNSYGQKVQTISSKRLWPAGQHQLDVNLKELPNGVYWVKMDGDEFSLTQNLLLFK